MYKRLILVGLITTGRASRIISVVISGILCKEVTAETPFLR